jgi:hypothetical protein
VSRRTRRALSKRIYPVNPPTARGHIGDGWWPPGSRATTAPYAQSISMSAVSKIDRTPPVPPNDAPTIYGCASARCGGRLACAWVAETVEGGGEA